MNFDSAIVSPFNIDDGVLVLIVVSSGHGVVRFWLAQHQASGAGSTIVSGELFAK